MVNNRIVPGKNLTRHPLAEEAPEGVFVRGAPFMAIRAGVGGILDTPEGQKTFHAGDWICTDLPATYAWIIDQQTFAVASYTRLGEWDPDNRGINFPIAEADHEVKHSAYTGRQELGEGTVGEEARAIAGRSLGDMLDSPESLAGGGAVAATATAPVDASPVAEAVANAAATDPLGQPTPVTPDPAPPVDPIGVPQVPASPRPQTKATLPQGVPTKAPRAKAGKS